MSLNNAGFGAGVEPNVELNSGVKDLAEAGLGTPEIAEPALAIVDKGLDGVESRAAGFTTPGLGREDTGVADVSPGGMSHLTLLPGVEETAREEEEAGEGDGVAVADLASLPGLEG